jgi:hypothetical protein
MGDPVKKLSVTHELLGDWILANPGGTYREMSAHFNYSVSWLCQIVNSDMFKAYMAERVKEVHSLVSMDIPTMLKGTAALAIERVNDVLVKTEDAEIVADLFDKVMNRYGYSAAPKTGALGGSGHNVQNNFYLTKDDFNQAQEQLKVAHQTPAPAIPEKIADGVALPAA